MADQLKLLFAGESWVTHSVHIKGADSFEGSSYHEGGTAMITAMQERDIEVTYLPCHVAAEQFPFDIEQLSIYDVVILSDIGANTFLLPYRTAIESRRAPNRLELIHQFVHAGGGLLMVGGYMTFQGISAKANYKGSPVEDVLPVELLPGDDRHEAPQGYSPLITLPHHPIASGLAEWPHFLGYNRSTPRPGCELIATINGDPFIAATSAGNGRSAIFSSDCGPHWGPPEFLNWQGYGTLWSNMARWLAGRT